MIDFLSQAGTTLSGFILGDVNIDFYGHFSCLPKKGDSSLTNDLTLNLGGAGFNFTQTLSSMGANPVLLSNLGDDLLGRVAKNKINSLSINQDGIHFKNGNTGFMFCIITPNGERTMLGCRGVNEDPIDYLKRSKDILNDIPDYILISSYVLLDEKQRSKALSFIGKFQKANIATVMTDLYAKNYNNLGKDIFYLSDLIFMNQSEFNLICGSINHDNLITFARHYNINNLIVTLGNEGCLICNNKKANKINGFKVEAKDTTGSGDVFAASYLYSYLNNFSNNKSALFGNFCGALVANSNGIYEPVLQLKNYFNGNSKESKAFSREYLQKIINILRRNN